MEVRILHIADVHFDASFTGMPASEADKCRAGLRSAFAASVLSARNRGVELFLIAGDLFDGEHLTADTRDFIISQTERFPECHFFIAPGNHDPYNDASPYARMSFPENVHVFRGRGKVELPELGVDVYGYGFTERSCEDSVAKGYGELNPDRINILVTHGDLGTSSSYGRISREDIADSGFDYIALGHVHTHSGVVSENGTYYAYSGCIQGRGMDETGVKGALYGTVGKGSAELEFLPLSRRRYEILQFDIKPEYSRKEVLEQLGERLLKFDGDCRVRVILQGETENALLLNADSVKSFSGTTAEIELVDKTGIAVSLTDAEAQNTLRGVFCRRMKALIEGENEVDKETATLAFKLGLEAFAGRLGE